MTSGSMEIKSTTNTLLVFCQLSRANREQEDSCFFLSPRQDVISNEQQREISVELRRPNQTGPDCHEAEDDNQLLLLQNTTWQLGNTFSTTITVFCSRTSYYVIFDTKPFRIMRFYYLKRFEIPAGFGLGCGFSSKIRNHSLSNLDSRHSIASRDDIGSEHVHSCESIGSERPLNTPI